MFLFIKEVPKKALERGDITLNGNIAFDRNGDSFYTNKKGVVKIPFSAET